MVEQKEDVLVLNTTVLKAGAPLESFIKNGQATLQTVSIGNATTIAMSGAAHSVRYDLNPPNENAETEISIEIPQKMIKSFADDVVSLDANAHLLFTDTRTVVAINGSLAQAVSGQGAARVQQLFTASSTDAMDAPDATDATDAPVLRGEHMTTINLTYADWQTPTATLTARNSSVVRKTTGRPVGVRFDATALEAQKLEEKRHYAALSKYSNAAWTYRKEEKVYEPLELLTKTSALGALGAEFVAEAISRPPAYAPASLAKMLEIEVRARCNTPEAYDVFLNDTKQPGLVASSHAQTVGDALSTGIAKLVSYHTDGSVVVGTGGLETKAKEFWNQNIPFDPSGIGALGDDCDAGATAAVSILEGIRNDMDADALAAHPIFAHVRNATALHTPCLSVLSALGPEASKDHKAHGAHGAHAPALAGHAVTLLLPTHLLHLGLHATAKDAKLAELRREADFGAVLTTLSESDASMFASIDAIEANAAQLSKSIGSWAIEGTTPADSLLYDESRIDELVTNEKEDRSAMAKVPPNIGRCTARLTYGRPGNEERSKFYEHFVEVNVPLASKLWRDPALRVAGAASMQFVLTGGDGRVGASPKDLVAGTFDVDPIATIDASEADAIDAWAATKRLYYESPRVTPAPTLCPFQAENVRASLRALRALQTESEARGDDIPESPVLEYHLGINALLNNPRAVLHFCNTMRDVGKAFEVSIDEIPDLATFPDAQAGDALAFVRVNVQV